MAKNDMDRLREWLEEEEKMLNGQLVDARTCLKEQETTQKQQIGRLESAVVTLRSALEKLDKLQDQTCKRPPL